MPLSTLCQRCGLCCDGTLFTSVPLQRGEAAALRQRASVVERADGAQALAQRCAALEGCHCTVYASRPEACRRYHCLLYAALAEGEVSLDEALSLVEQAHVHVDAMAAELEPASERNPAGAVMQRARRAEQPAHGGPLSPQAHAVRERAEAFLDQHFRGRHRQAG